jgi:hypothetical protein
MSLPASLSFGGFGGDGQGPGGDGGVGMIDSLTGTPPAASDGDNNLIPDGAGGGGGGGAGAVGGSGGAGGGSGGAGGVAGQPGIDAGNGVGGGGHASPGFGPGGGGGAGGAHGYVGDSLPTSAAAGQDGGRGGNGDSRGGGGGGGAGGHGAVITGSGALGTLSVNVTGGAGGSGGDTTDGQAGEGGDAGYALVFASSLATSVTINSTIRGQSGGANGAGLPPVGLGQDKHAIIGEDLDITLAAQADIQAAGGAIYFAGGTNALELQAGAVVSGEVLAFGLADTLRLGGSANASFNLAALGPQFNNFEAVQKVGASTWTLTGTTSAAIPWSIDAGTLHLVGATSSASLTTVNAGGTLSGSGAIGALNVASGGILSPGASAGSLATGNLALAAGATYRAEIDNGATAFTGYDQVGATGTVALGSATLSLAVDAAIAPGTIFLILANDGTDAISGTFGGLAEGATIDAGKARFSISYLGGDGNDVVLTALPRGTAGNDGFTAQAGSERIDALGGVDTVTFAFRLVDATVTYEGNTVVIDSASSHTVLSGVEKLVFTDGTVDNADGHRLVDDLFYYAQNHDVWNTHIDADLHYGVSGWHEGRNPNAFFDASLYRVAYPDVTGDPLLHFDTIGWRQDRVPSLGFGTREYLAANPDVAAANIDPLWHFLAVGAGEGRLPTAPTTLTTANGFDYVYYLQQNPDVAAAGVDPLQHFQTTGWHEGRNPNALFDTAGYLATYTDVAAAGVNPLDHYHLSGWQEGRDPSLAFDTASYLAANPDVAAAHIDPLKHFLHSGSHEGRVAFADATWG